ncbi:hypothetical protein [Rossellomorea aquimaris]|nr:hypothetical protein [Rossellomorea aquimaris]
MEIIEGVKMAPLSVLREPLTYLLQGSLSQNHRRGWVQTKVRLIEQ